MTIIRSTFVVAVLAACASSGRTTETSTATAVAATATSSGPVEGTYDYIANLPGQQVRGQMRVLADTVIIDPMSDYCRPVVVPPDQLAYRYTCNGPGNVESLQFRIDRRNPERLSTWTAAYRVQKRREVCTQYAVRDGRQVCVQTSTEVYETTENRSGTLLVRRVR
jgi:hypothetical protein